ncbi:hypothetical protein [Microcystis sp. M061S2]|uniref:hypothetical protein n=1 Tax=Microcystis sp. M061S2 TaxID=2771171 RepID=UPI0025849A53|nr:hypothetical protein [Microcystis sp. M061S2]MCA2652905.1 hypothetical protein [Microcystis sp. M061S2]
MPEFTGSMTITIEVTIKAKNRKQAESFFHDTYLNGSIETFNASIETNEHSDVEILSDNTESILMENYWKIED